MFDKNNLKDDFFLVEGIKDILDILNIDKNLISNEFIDSILWHKKSLNLSGFSEIQSIALQNNIKLIEITNSELQNLKNTVTSYGVFALVKRKKFNLTNILKSSDFVVVLDNIQDPGNFGTIIRTSSLLGVDAIFTINSSVKLSNPKVIRSTKGYFYNFPIIEDINSEELLLNLSKYNFNSFAADPKGVSIYNDSLVIEKPLCLFFGSEGKGFSSLISKNMNKICIPMDGHKLDNSNNKSLNIAISVGIIIAEVNRRWI